MTQPRNPSKGVKINQSIIRASKILKALAESGKDSTVNELSNAVDLPSSTVYRLLQTLESVGLVERSAENGQYRPGLELFRLGVSVLDQMGLGSEALPYMEGLAQASLETVNLATLQDFHILYLQKIESPQPLRTSPTIGRADVPAHCAATGKALLAHLADQRLEELLNSYPLEPFTPKTITNRQELQVELARIRDQGYAIDNLEYHSDIRAVAAPIRDYRGRVIAAIGTTGPASRLTMTRLYELVPEVVSTAAKISKRLGYEASELSNLRR